MKLQFKKGTQKPSVLTCIREDGTRTWTQLQREIEIHDLAHYVVETELGFSCAFYGLLAEGYNIEDFELPREQRPEALIPANLPVESLQTEHIVNLLMVSLYQGDDSVDFLNALKTILKENELAYPEALDANKLDQIFEKLKQLIAKWRKLESDEILELSFNPK